MEIGLLIEGQEGFGWNQWTDAARWAEDLGFESLWRSDHFIPLDAGGSATSLETFVSLTHLASVTSRIRFGPLVSPMTFRHPALVARMAAAIDVLSCGRLQLGLGTGWHAPEHDMFGIPLPSPRQRALALEEGATVIRLLLTGRRVSFDGRIYRLSGAQIRPARAIPIVIGGGGERYTLRVVARHADEWNLPGVDLEVYRHKTAVLEAFCELERRDPATIRRSMVFTHAIAKSGAAARRIADRLIARTPPYYQPGSRRGAPAWLVGTPSQVVEQLQAYADGGVSRVMLQYRHPPARDQLELIAAEVLPQLSRGVRSLAGDAS